MIFLFLIISILVVGCSLLLAANFRRREEIIELREDLIKRAYRIEYELFPRLMDRVDKQSKDLKVFRDELGLIEYEGLMGPYPVLSKWHALLKQLGVDFKSQLPVACEEKERNKPVDQKVSKKLLFPKKP